MQNALTALCCAATPLGCSAAVVCKREQRRKRTRLWVFSFFWNSLFCCMSSSNACGGGIHREPICSLIGRCYSVITLACTPNSPLPPTRQEKRLRLLFSLIFFFVYTDGAESLWSRWYFANFPLDLSPAASTTPSWQVLKGSSVSS